MARHFYFLAVFGLCLCSAISAAKTLSVDDFMADPDLLDIAISPNGRYMAEVRQQGKFRIAIIRDMQTPKFNIIGKLGDSIARPYSLTWANDERLIVHLLVPYNTKNVIRQSQKTDFDIDEHFMFSRSVAIDLNGNNPVALMAETRSQRATINLSNIRHTLPNDAKHILMSSYENGRLALYKVNVYDGSSEKVAYGGARTIHFICETDGTPRYRVDYLRVRKALAILELGEGGKWTPVDRIDFNPKTNNSDNGSALVGLSIKGDLLYRKKNETSGFYELVEQSRETKNLKVIASDPKHDIAGLIYAGNNDSVVGYRVEQDTYVNRYFDAQRQKIYDGIRQQVGSYGFHYASSDTQGKRHIISVYGPDLPLAYYLYESDSGKLRFYDVGYKRLPSDQLGLPAMANYKSRDGAIIRLYLIFPAGYEKGKQYPLVILPHGGPQARDYALYDDFAAYIASQGYFVARPNFRGSTGYGRAFEEAGYKQWGGIMQDDLQDAARFLIAQGYTSAGNICVVGSSYGGYAALMGAIKHSGDYACAVSINGVTHLRDQIEFDEKRFKRRKEILSYVHNSIGHPTQDAAMLDRNSPLLHVDKIKAPVMVVAGTDDETVPYQQSAALVKALQKAKKPVEWISLKDTGHAALYFDEDRRLVYEKVGEFLAQHLRQHYKP